MKNIAHLQQKLKFGKLTSIAGLLAILLNSLLYLLTQADASLALWLVQSVPLLLFVPGIYLNHYRTYSWLCFVVLFYFIVAVTNVMSPLAQLQDWVLLCATVVLFNAAMMTSRWLQYAAQVSNPVVQPEPLA